MEEARSGWSNKLHLKLLHSQMDRRRVRYDERTEHSMVYLLVAFEILRTSSVL